MLLSLSEIRDGIVNCSKCKLRTSCDRPVPGYGPPDAKIVVVGEAPGYYEEVQGKPFVGASGKYLTTLFNSIGINRRDIYFANSVNCRPPNNRDPMADESAACRDWLDKQIEAIDPKIIITVGRFSTKIFFSQGTITSLHGSSRFDGKRLYVAMYHPAAAMHNPSLKSAIENDFLKLGDLIKDMNI